MTRAKRSGSQQGRQGLFRRFWFSMAPDVVGLLVAQGQVSVQAMAAFAEWSDAADHDRAATVLGLERDADSARRALLHVLRSALATPIDQEDLYLLSERCDRVVDTARNITAEAEAIGWVPDGHASVMAGHLRDAMGHVVDGFAALSGRPDDAGKAADAAVHQAHAVERAYRSAMAELVGMKDLRTVFTTRELYRSYARCGDLVVAVADRLWYAVLAER